jgi:hypothetical protein
MWQNIASGMCSYRYAALSVMDFVVLCPVRHHAQPKTLHFRTSLPTNVMTVVKMTAGALPCRLSCADSISLASFASIVSRTAIMLTTTVSAPLLFNRSEVTIRLPFLPVPLLPCSSIFCSGCSGCSVCLLSNCLLLRFRSHPCGRRGLLVCTILTLLSSAPTNVLFLSHFQRLR